MKRREFLGTAAAIPAAAVLPIIEKKESKYVENCLELVYDFETDLAGYKQVDQAGFFDVSRNRAFRQSRLEFLVNEKWIPYDNFIYPEMRSGFQERWRHYKLWGKMFVKIEALYDPNGKLVKNIYYWTELPETIREKE